MSGSHRFAALLVSASILAACDSHMSNERSTAPLADSPKTAIASMAAPVPPVSLAVSANPLLPKEEADSRLFAIAVGDALRQARELSLRADIMMNQRSVQVTSTMRPRYLDTTVTHLGRTIAMFRLRDGLMEEEGAFTYDPSTGDRKDSQRQKYTTPYPDGTDSAYFSSSDSCLFGSYMRSWAGQDSYFAGFLQKRLASGRELAPKYIGDERCRVFEHVQQPDTTPDAYTRRDVFVVAEDSKLLKEWNTYESNPAAQRLRRFDIQIMSSVSPTVATNVAH